MKYITLPLVIGVCVLLFNCFDFESQHAKPTSEANQTPLPFETSSFERPIGNEIEIEARRISPNEYVIELRNVSNQRLYCAYVPGKDTELAQYFPYITEKKEGKSGEFEVINKGGHFAPGLHPIDPKRLVKFKFYSYDNGEYRLRFFYLIDESAVSFINRIDQNNRPTKGESDKILAAYSEFTTPIMKIERTLSY